MERQKYKYLMNILFLLANLLETKKFEILRAIILDFMDFVCRSLQTSLMMLGSGGERLLNGREI